MIWLTIIATAGALQGIAILIFMALRLRHGRNLSLALLIIVFSARLATIPTWDYDILLHHPWLWPATTALPFLFAPLVWWYLRDMVTGVPKAYTSFLGHCLPWFIEVVLLCISLISMTPVEYQAFLQNVFSGNPPLWLPVRNGLKVLVNLVYLSLSLILVFSTKARRLSPAKKFWMRSLVFVPFLVLLSFSVVALWPETSGRLSGGEAAPFLILSLFMSFLILLVATFFMVNPDLFSISETLVDCGDNQFPEDKCIELQSRLEQRMDEGVFKNPDLSLPDLASEFGVSSNLLSHTVNCYCGKGFRVYLNGKRLSYFLNQLERGRKQSILELAFESGFSSKSTFNRVFHEQTGMTPTEYLSRNEKMIQN